MKPHVLAAVLLPLALQGCAAAPAWIPGPRAAADAEPPLTLVWVGRGEAERLESGAWIRVPEFDYEFSVEQRRFGDHWESVKSMVRRHPAYDGSAGPRAQTYYFQIQFRAQAEGLVGASITSSLGSGTGSTDREFRSAVLEMRPEISSMAPFDRYVIRQSYLYEQGRLEETVELNKGDRPWVRNRETATLFAPRKFEAPPTKL